MVDPVTDRRDQGIPERCCHVVLAAWAGDPGKFLVMHSPHLYMTILSDSNIFVKGFGRKLQWFRNFWFWPGA